MVTILCHGVYIFNLFWLDKKYFDDVSMQEKVFLLFPITLQTLLTLIPLFYFKFHYLTELQIMLKILIGIYIIVFIFFFFFYVNFIFVSNDLQELTAEDYWFIGEVIIQIP